METHCTQRSSKSSSWIAASRSRRNKQDQLVRCAPHETSQPGLSVGRRPTPQQSLPMLSRWDSHLWSHVRFIYLHKDSLRRAHSFHRIQELCGCLQLNHWVKYGASPHCHWPLGWNTRDMELWYSEVESHVVRRAEGSCDQALYLRANTEA